DLVEQQAAALVVEPDGRQGLLLGQETVPDVGLERGAPRVRRDVDIDGHRRSHGSSRVQSRANRTPVNGHREPGGKKLRYVARVWPAGVAQPPPRRTCWLTMHLPLYSPTAPAAGRKP